MPRLKPTVKQNVNNMNPINFSDFFHDDGVIEDLVKQLNGIKDAIEGIRGTIKKEAEGYKVEMDSLKSSTIEGRAEIEKLSNAVSDLAKVNATVTSINSNLEDSFDKLFKKIAALQGSMTKQTNILKELKNDTSIAANALIELAEASAKVTSNTGNVSKEYNKLKKQLNEAIAAYKEMAVTDGLAAANTSKYAEEIKNLESQLHAVDTSVNAVKKSVDASSEAIAKSTMGVGYLQAQYNALKAQLSETAEKYAEATIRVKASEGADMAAAAAEAEHKEKLESLRSAMDEVAQKLSIKMAIEKEANDVLKRLTKTTQTAVEVNDAAGGSYAALSNEYSALKKQLDNLADPLGANIQQFEELASKLGAVHTRMEEIQERTGRYTLTVGKYQNAWRGLTRETSQLVRELPSLAVSWNQFFLAISNNLPMFKDEIDRIKESNKQLLEHKAQLEAAGDATAAARVKIIPVWGQIAKAVFSWNTAIVIAISLAAKFGSKWIEQLSKIELFNRGLNDFEKTWKQLNKKINDTAKDAAKNITQFTKLSTEFKRLNTEAEKLKFIEQYRTSLNSLGLQINTVADAQNLLINRSQDVINAYINQARAAVASKLAQEQMQDAIEARLKAQKNLIDLGYDPLSGQTEQQFIEENLRKRKEYTDYVRQAAKYQEDLERWQQDTTQGLMPRAEDYDEGAIAYFKIVNAIDRYNDKMEDANKATKEAQRIINMQLDLEGTYAGILTGTYTQTGQDRAAAIADIHKKILTIMRKNNDDLEALEVDSIEKENLAIRHAYDERLEEINILEAERLKLVAKAKDNNTALTEEELKKLNDLEIALGTARAEEVQDLENRLLELRKKAGENNNRLSREEADELLKIEKKLGKARIDALILRTYLEERLIIKRNIRDLNLQKDAANMAANIAREGSDEQLNYKLKAIDLEKEAALEANKLLSEAERKSTDLIEKEYDKRKTILIANSKLARETAVATLATTEAMLLGVSRPQRQETRAAVRAARQATPYGTKRTETLSAQKYELTAQLADIERQLASAEARNISEDQVNKLKAQKLQIQAELVDLADWTKYISPEGLLQALGLSPQQASYIMDTFGTVTDYIVDRLQEIVQAEIDAAQAAVDAQHKIVEAAQSAYDAEVQARANGYASAVREAEARLQLEKKREAEKQKILEEAQKKQERLNTLSQISSLITAVAGIWQGAGILGPIIGPVVAGLATATMFGAFTAAKIKAREVSSQAYGEGGLEFLEGGSHASGNDIDLHTKNRKGRNMRAEGGEAMAIINKRNTRKYKKALPSIIDSLNKGIFEDKYLRAFEGTSQIALNTIQNNIDLTNIENGVDAIRNQNKVKCVPLKDGGYMIISGNNRKIVHKN